MAVTETDAIERLSNWLKKNNWRVLQDKKNNFQNCCFHVKGYSTKKPDLIMIKNKNFIAIEVKSGKGGRDLGKYSKLLTYFEDYNNGRTFYFDENDVFIQISDFVIGTYFSPEGHLCCKELLRECSKNHHQAYRRNQNPKNEYTESFNIIRRGIWDNINRRKYKNYDVGVGALLSSVLNNDSFEKPCIFVMKPNKKSRRWRPIWNSQL